MAARNYNFPPLEPEKPHLVHPRKRSRWKPVVWALGILLILVLVVGVGVYVLLRSAAFHNYVLRTAEQKASDSLSTGVQLQNFVIHPGNLSLDLYGLRVNGAGPGANLPLLQVDHIRLGVRIISVLHRQWNLDNVVIDHPVVKLIVDQAGQSNIPTPKPSNSNSSVNLFDLAIQHVLLDRGEVYYNDRESPLRADLHDLTLRSTYETTEGGRYVGNLSYRSGNLQYAGYAPIEHDLSADFDARRSRFLLKNVVLRADGSQVQLDASLENYNAPRVHAKYSISVDSTRLAQTLRNDSVPRGTIFLDGTADYVDVAGKPFLDTTTVNGNVRSQLLPIISSDLKADIRDLNANYSLANNNAEIHDLRARLLGGQLKGVLTVRDVSGKAEGHATASLRGLSLADIKAVANSASMRTVTVSGSANADAEANWTGNMQDLVAQLNAVAHATVAPGRQSNSPTAVPVEADVHAGYNNARQEITLRQSSIRMPATQIQANGTVSKRSALQFKVQSSDLHELETIADAFSQPVAGEPAPQPLGLYGTASFDGTVRGTTANPQIAGLLMASNLKIHGTAIRLLRTNVQASPSGIGLQNGTLQLASQGHANFSGQVGLAHWSYVQSSPFTLNLNASQLPVEELARAASVNVPITGTLNANLVAYGTALNPVGQGSVTLRNASISGEPVQAADVRFQGTGDAVRANLQVQMPAGTMKGNGTYFPKQKGYEATLSAPAVQLEKIKTLRDRNLKISGTLNLSASGRGTLQDPEAQASLTIPQLDVQGQQIRDINFQGDVANHTANFTLSSAVSNTPLHAEGKVALTGDYYAEARVDTPVVPLQPLLAAYAPAQAADLSGQTEIHATLRGPLKNRAQLEAHLNIPTLSVSYHGVSTTGGSPMNVQIGAVSPIRADYAAGVLTLQPGEIKGTGTDIHFQGRVPIESRAGSTLGLRGTVDLALARMFNPDVTGGGQLQFDVNAAGTNAQDVEGQIRVVNASFAMTDMPIGLTKANGVLNLRNDRLDIAQFVGEMGGGTLTASGGVTFRPAVQFYIGLKGQDVRLLYPASVRSGLGANLVMTGNLDSAVLQGQVTVNSISFTPDFDLSSFIAQFGGVSTPAPSQGFADNLKLNIGVRSGSELRAASPQVSIEGDVNLRVIGTASDPVIVGRTNLSGGDLIFLGNRYVVQGGTITFANAIETRPIVNLQVSTTVQQYNISMRFQGPLDRLHTNYTSDPSLPPADIIHLLAFGQTEEASNANPAQSTTLGAEAAVASQVTGQITSRVQKVVGISQLSVDPQLGNNPNAPAGAIITVQQRVTSNLFVTFSTDVTATQNTTVQLQYRLNRKWSISGVRDQNGGFSLDGRYHKDF